MTWYVQPRANGRYSRVGNQNGPANCVPGPEYDDPANCAPEEDQYGSQYGQYGAPYDHYGSRGSVSRRSVGAYFKLSLTLSVQDAGTLSNVFLFPTGNTKKNIITDFVELNCNNIRW